ncbi:hypothetical protein ACFSKM_17095 [Ancylobacter dichloromethanicus]
MKAEAAFSKVTPAPTAQGLGNLLLRMEILRSRLPLLYDSDEGRVLSDVVDTKGLTQPLETLLDQVIAEIETLDPDDGATTRRLEALHGRLLPLGEALQRILMESVAYNQEIFRRERAVAEAPEVVSLVLLFITGGCLVLLLLLQGRRDRVRLREIVDAKAAITAMEENLRAVIQAVPACVAVVDPDTGHATFINSNAAALVAATPDDAAWPGFVRAVRDAAGSPSAVAGARSPWPIPAAPATSSRCAGRSAACCGSSGRSNSSCSPTLPACAAPSSRSCRPRSWRRLARWQPPSPTNSTSRWR